MPRLFLRSGVDLRLEAAQDHASSFETPRSLSSRRADPVAAPQDEAPSATRLIVCDRHASNAK